MLDPQKLLDQFLGGVSSSKTSSTVDSGRGLDMKSLAAGGAASGLLGLLLGSKKGRKMGGKLLRFGAVAAIGGLAWRAYQQWQAQQAQAPAAPPAGAAATAPQTPFESDESRFLPPPDRTQERNEMSQAILRAMIAAAKADGHVDAEEQQRIFARLDEAGLDMEAKAFVVDELRRPLDIEAVVAEATTPERAAEIYTASLLAIDPDDPAERAYLQMLASRLELDPAYARKIEAEVSRAQEA